MIVKVENGEREFWLNNDFVEVVTLDYVDEHRARTDWTLPSVAGWYVHVKMRSGGGVRLGPTDSVRSARLLVDRILAGHVVAARSIKVKAAGE